MILLRPSRERGRADHGWLQSFHTFSFADYQDTAHMGFRTLRVINEDFVRPGRGFPDHPHRDMEILTWVLSGAVAHADSMGNAGLVRPGEIQRMSAGTGVVHSERNPSDADPLHLLQIWILPAHKGLPPGYEQKAFPEASRRGRLRLVASPDGAEGSVTLHQDVRLYATLLAPGNEAVLDLAPGRHAWVQAARGTLAINGTRLEAGDGAAVSGEPRLTLRGEADAEAMVFDLG